MLEGAELKSSIMKGPINNCLPMSPKKIMKWPQGRDTKCYALKISNILKVLSAFCMLPNL